MPILPGAGLPAQRRLGHKNAAGFCATPTDFVVSSRHFHQTRRRAEITTPGIARMRAKEIEKDERLSVRTWNYLGLRK